MCALVDPFAGSPAGEIRAGGVTVRMLEVRISDFDSGFNSRLLRLGDALLFCWAGGTPIYALELDERAGAITGSIAGVRPLGGQDCALCPISHSRLMVLGGHRDGRYHDTARVLSVGRGTAEEYPGMVYRARSAGAVVIGGRFLLVVGGYNSEYVPALAMLDLRTRTWSPVGHPEDREPPRLCPLCVLRPGYVYVLGGADSPACLRLGLRELGASIRDPGVRAAFSEIAGLTAEQLLARSVEPAWDRAAKRSRATQRAYSAIL